MPTGIPGSDQEARSESRRLHKALEETATRGQFISAAAKAHSDASARSELKANPKAYFAKHGEHVPDEVEMELGDRDAKPALKLRARRKSVEGGIEIWSNASSVSTERGAVADFKKLVRGGSRALVSDAALDVLGKARTDEAARAELKANPKGYLRAHGVDVPDDVTVEVSETANPLFCYSWHVCNSWGCCTRSWLCWWV